MKIDDNFVSKVFGTVVGLGLLAMGSHYVAYNSSPSYKAKLFGKQYIEEQHITKQDISAAENYQSCVNNLKQYEAFKPFESIRSVISYPVESRAITIDTFNFLKAQNEILKNGPPDQYEIAKNELHELLLNPIFQNVAEVSKPDLRTAPTYYTTEYELGDYTLEILNFQSAKKLTHGQINPSVTIQLKKDGTLLAIGSPHSPFELTPYINGEEYSLEKLLKINECSEKYVSTKPNII